MGTGILPVLPFPSSVQSSSPMPPPLSQAFPLTSVPYPHAKGLTPWTLPLGFRHKERSPLGRLQVWRLGDVGKLPCCLIAILGKMLGSNGLPPNLQYWQCTPLFEEWWIYAWNCLAHSEGRAQPLPRSWPQHSMQASTPFQWGELAPWYTSCYLFWDILQQSCPSLSMRLEIPD